MWKAWTKLSQANLDHYNERTGEHYAAMAGLAVVAVVTFRKLGRFAEKQALNGAAR